MSTLVDMNFTMFKKFHEILSENKVIRTHVSSFNLHTVRYFIPMIIEMCVITNTLHYTIRQS